LFIGCPFKFQHDCIHCCDQAIFIRFADVHPLQKVNAVAKLCSGKRHGECLSSEDVAHPICTNDRGMKGTELLNCAHFAAT